MDSMVNLTPRAQQVLILAKQEAERFGHQFVGTEHVLSALLKIQQCIAVSILCSMNVDARQVQLKLEKQLANTKTSDSRGGKNSTTIELTPRVQKVLLLAAKEAGMLQHPYVGTEHILLGLLREEDSVAAQILIDCGVNIANCRQALLAALDPNFADDGEDDDGEDASNGELVKNSKRAENVKTPALRAFGRDLTAVAREGGLDPIIGRDREIERVVQILCRRTKIIPPSSVRPVLGKPPLSKAWPRQLPMEPFRRRS
jgi:ATP-dependent Clp protease ATP-binding subunit ClpC